MTGYKYEPWKYVIVIENILIANRLYDKLSSPLVVLSSSSRRFIDPSTSVSTDNLVSCLVSFSGFKLGSRGFLVRS
jgi:hypothetical protein